MSDGNFPTLTYGVDYTIGPRVHASLACVTSEHDTCRGGAWSSAEFSARPVPCACPCHQAHGVVDK